MRLTHVLLTAVNIIRGVRACMRTCVRACVHAYACCYPRIHASAPSPVSHASRTLNSRDTRTTCAALDEPKQTSASESGTRRRRGRTRRSTRGGRAYWTRGSGPTNPPPHALTPLKVTNDIRLHRRNDAYTRTIVKSLSLLACFASNCKYIAEQKRAKVISYVASCGRPRRCERRAHGRGCTRGFCPRKNTEPGDLN